VTLELRRLVDDDDHGLAAFVALVNEVTPEATTSIEEERWADATYPGGVRFLATIDGAVAGAATVGRIYMYDAEYERSWFSVRVLPRARGRGIGTALWSAASGVARDAGKTGLQTSVSEVHADGIAWLLRRGFAIVERDLMVRLELGGMAPPAVDPPPGIVITSLTADPGLLDGVHAVAVEAYPDIPVADEPVAAGGLEEFVARDVRRAGVAPDAFMVAVDEATGEVVGWASLLLVPGRPAVAYHDMTAVARRWRGRGVASALKRATIAWAIGHGLEALETGNDEANVPMRAVNTKLGYRPMPDELTLRGPLAPGESGRAVR
jgi:GNAT superfamily N-acetyltransferase